MWNIPIYQYISSQRCCLSIAWCWWISDEQHSWSLNEGFANVSRVSLSILWLKLDFTLPSLFFHYDVYLVTHFKTTPLSLHVVGKWARTCVTGAGCIERIKRNTINAAISHLQGSLIKHSNQGTVLMCELVMISQSQQSSP